jgi:hypothetical protein
MDYPKDWKTNTITVKIYYRKFGSIISIVGCPIIGFIVE